MNLTILSFSVIFCYKNFSLFYIVLYIPELLVIFLVFQFSCSQIIVRFWISAAFWGLVLIRRRRLLGGSVYFDLSIKRCGAYFRPGTYMRKDYIWNASCKFESGICLAISIPSQGNNNLETMYWQSPLDQILINVSLWLTLYLSSLNSPKTPPFGL